MSILQKHFENRRRYIFDRLKQPGYEKQSIRVIQQAKIEIEENLKEMTDLLHLDAQDNPCLPPIASLTLMMLQIDEDHQDFRTITEDQLYKLNQKDRESVLESTLEMVNKVTNLQRTIFIMMHKNKEDILMEFYEKNPKKESTLHYDENDRKGFNKDVYQEKIYSLKNDIRVVSFKKFCSNEEGPGDDILAFKQRFENVVVPKVQEIISLIDPCLIELEIFMKPVIRYGIGHIDLEAMLKNLDENLSSLHALSKVQYCPTLEMTVREYLFVEAMNNADKVKELEPSK